MNTSIAKTKAKNALTEMKSAKAELFSIRQSEAMTPYEYMKIIQIRAELADLISGMEKIVEGGES